MKNHDELCAIYTTMPDVDAAEALARELVTKKFAACVNIFPHIRSVYTWNGDVNTNDECGMLIKTSVIKQKELIEWLVKNHPYSTPAVLACDVKTSDAFFQYVTKSLSPF